MNRRALFFGTAAAALTRVAPARAQTAAPIRLGYTLNDSGLEGVYGQESGIMAQAGLALELQPFTNTGTMAQAIAAGAIDVGVLDVLQAGNAAINGVPLALFAGGVFFSKEHPTLVMVTTKSSPIRAPRDLENQAVGIPVLRGLSTSAALEWVRVNGGDPAKVKPYEIPFAQMGEALKRGTIAAALQGEPFLSAGKADQRILGVPFEALGAAFYINAFAASRDWLTKNGALAKRLAAALYKTAAWANAHQPETAAIESRYTKLPIEVVRPMARNMFATSFDLRLIDPVLALGAKYALTSRPVHAGEVAFIL